MENPGLHVASVRGLGSARRGRQQKQNEKARETPVHGLPARHATFLHPGLFAPLAIISANRA